jgi:NADP-dependent 3-hydroxy acid dehydrogenase YdfG
VVLVYFDVVGKTVVVTGASSGIGAATARLLHHAGARPVLAARRADRLRDLSAELGGALAVETDVTDRGQIKALIDATLNRHGRIDALVNNAGAGLHQTLDAVDPDEFLRVLDLNVVSVLTMTQAVLPAMRQQGGGRNADRSRLRPGTVSHSAEYVARAIVRALRTGEARVDIPRGPERPG